MPVERKLTLFLIASLALNIFLGGVLGGKLLSEREQTVPIAALGKNDETPGRVRQPHLDRDKPPHRKGADARRRGRPDSEGPSDLLLLRQMIRIMGGPKDERISKLHEERRDEIHRVRSDMQAAHRRVHEALTAEELNKAELDEALKNLRKTAFESQARAQEGILTLARLMTPEERAKLRKLRPDKTPDGPPPPLERPGSR